MRKSVFLTRKLIGDAPRGFLQRSRQRHVRYSNTKQTGLDTFPETENFTDFCGLMFWLGARGTSRKVARSSPDKVDFFNLPKPSSRTMALGSTQPLTEMSNWNLPGGQRAAGVLRRQPYCHL
jgi:hypothetical protein